MVTVGTGPTVRNNKGGKGVTMIRVGINGYGNLGRGVERAVAATRDMRVVAVFTRRDPDTLATDGAPAVSVSSMGDYADQIDVMINCGGSATDLGAQSPLVASLFTVVDSFDTHAAIPEHFARVDAAATEAGTTAIISSGWDPGLFSLMRVLFDSVLPAGSTTTFWGPGISQGHSDAVRRIEGVADAKQYTLPIPATVEAIRAGDKVELTPRTMHRRDVYVVAEEGADLDRIRTQIVTMENYFDAYDTEVTFVTAEELERDHSGMPHGGQVLRRGDTSAGTASTLTFGLELGSNPEFTGSVLVATARAAYRRAKRGLTGAATIFDLPLGDFSPASPQELRSAYL